MTPPRRTPVSGLQQPSWPPPPIPPPHTPPVHRSCHAPLTCTLSVTHSLVHDSSPVPGCQRTARCPSHSRTGGWGDLGTGAGPRGGSLSGSNCRTTVLRTLIEPLAGNACMLNMQTAPSLHHTSPSCSTECHHKLLPQCWVGG